MTDISNSDDIIDSRGVIARIEELEEQLDDTIWYASYDELKEELEVLSKLAQKAEGYAPDWTHGTALIRESYFTTYVQELLADIDAIPTDLPNYIEVNWDATARNIKADYTEVEFDGVTYLIR